MARCEPPHRRGPGHGPGGRWRRGGPSFRPPFGLQRQIYWSLVGSMVVASLLTLAVSSRWLHSGGPSWWTGAAFALVILALLWMSSWRLAMRLAMPLNRLVGVVQKFASGDLTARARFATGSRDEVARVATAFDSMADRLEQQVRDERQLLAVVSHELRTPLSRIRVLTALAREGQSDAIEEIDREVSEIDDLVSKVLARSRLTFGTMTPRAVDVVAAASEALDRAGLPVDLLHVASDEDTSVTADPTLLHRAIANLLDNAQRHGKGIERVEMRPKNGEIELEVLDRGPGFSNDASRRFEAFAPDETGARGAGLGLGLHLVAAIVAAHRGRVWAENRADGGARVGFALPVATVQQA